MTDDEINAAVAWWVATLRDRPIHDNGDAFQSAFATVASAGAPAPTELQLRAFAEHLSASLRNPDVATYHKGILSCDYSPEGLLLNAAKYAGIDLLRFPLKTVMWVGSGYVTVKRGYGAEAVGVYPLSQG